jgi:hypothetical protein
MSLADWATVVGAGVAVATALAGGIRAVLKWRERRLYGPGEPVFDLTGKRVTWKRRTGG